MFNTILTTHKVPVLVTGMGLALAFGLAIAPTVTSNSGNAQTTSMIAAQTAALDTAAQRDQAMQAQQDAIAAQVSALQEQVRVHDLAISRTFSRLVAIRSDTAAMQVMLKDADTNSVHISNLNRAVTRLNLKIRDLTVLIDPNSN